MTHLRADLKKTVKANRQVGVTSSKAAPPHTLPDPTRGWKPGWGPCGGQETPTSHLAGPPWVHLQGSSSPPGGESAVWAGHTLQTGAPPFGEGGREETDKGTQNLRLIRVEVKYFIYIKL